MVTPLDPRARPLETAVWAALADVPDPEIPTVSVLDLGLVADVAAGPGHVRVEILPTFVGCPAVEAIREAIRLRLSVLADDVEVAVSFSQPWTTERITPQGRDRLRASGFAPPPGDGTELPVVGAVCPHCGSRRTSLENLFGPTLCRSIYWCAGCRQPFEQFKPI